jgi:hypothetical protein
MVRWTDVSSGNDVHSNPEEHLQLSRGQQGILAMSSVGTAFQHLPPRATDNLLIVSSARPDEVASTLEGMGVSLSNVGMIPVSGAAVEYDGPMAVSDPIVPDDLTGLSMRYAEGLDALQPGRGWVVFDRLNVLLLYAEEERVLRFLDHVAVSARDRELRSLFCVVRDAVDDRTYAKLKRRVDTEIDLR